MKFIYTLLLIGIFCPRTFAQETEKKYTQEMGVSAASLNNFGFVYRIGNENSMWRASLLSLEYRNRESESKISTLEELSYGYRVAIGKEFRKELHSKFEFRYGVDVFYQSDFLKTKQIAIDKSQFAYFEENDKIEDQEYGINLVIGMNYKIKSNIIIGAEFNPSVSIFTTEQSGSFESFITYEETKNSSDGLNLGIQSDLVLLTVAFRY